MKKFLLVALSFILAQALLAQEDYWTSRSVTAPVTLDKAVLRPSFPSEFKLFDLHIAPLRTELFSIVGNNARSRSTIIDLPNADGQIEKFEVVEASNFEPA